MPSLESIINSLSPEEIGALIRHLEAFVNPERLSKIEHILSRRTRTLTVVLEDTYRNHNASAVLRTCDCFGVQDVHVIESHNRFEINTSIVQGASKWITLRRHRGPDANEACFRALKSAGYRLVAMSPGEHCTPLTEVEPWPPLALCFGSEEPGLSELALKMSDIQVSVPMQGFTQSLNLSVSVGISLYHLRRTLDRSPNPWQLKPGEVSELRALWLARSIRSGRLLAERFISEIRCSA